MFGTPSYPNQHLTAAFCLLQGRSQATFPFPRTGLPWASPVLRSGPQGAAFPLGTLGLPCSPIVRALVLSLYPRSLPGFWLQLVIQNMALLVPGGSSGAILHPCSPLFQNVTS